MTNPMVWTVFHHWMWFWCWLCYRAYMMLPAARTHRSLYGKLTLWLLGYAGVYAYSTREDFHRSACFQSSTSKTEAGE